MSTDELMQEILSDPFADVTFSGGDPFYQAEGFAELAARIKAETEKTIWCYTGFRFEQLRRDAAAQQLLRHIDVLVDGPFIQSLHNEELLFCGSSNQRLIDVQCTLADGNIVLWKREDCEA